MPENKVAIIVVAPFWLHFFKTKTGKNSVFLFPNFFEKLVYDNFNKSEKVNQIHLGQYSFKNDAQLNELAKKLHYAGYHCYFSTNNKQEAMQLAYHEICFFESFEAYLLQMAQSKYTLALTSINEGWNRVAHESLLLGTQVIGYKKGGLGDLLTGANAIIVNTIDEAYSNIINNKHQEINREFLSNFQKSDSNKRILEIIKFLIIN